ncbi:MAG TPA: lactate dehydrogenase, partial [Rhodopila sp.]
VDVLVFQRREPGADGDGPEWHDVVQVRAEAEGEGALTANRYFAHHSEMVLGEHAWTSSPYGPIYTCRPIQGQDLEAALNQALAIIAAATRFSVRPAAPERAAQPRIVVGTAAEGAAVKEGSYVLVANRLHQVIDGEPAPVAIKSAASKTGIFAKHARIIQALIPVRDALRAVLRAQEANESWSGHQSRLRQAYHSFVRQFGPVNLTTISTRTDEETGEVTETLRRPNLQPFLDDPDCWLVASIEDYDIESGTAKQGPVFSQRVIHPPVEPVIASAADALAVTLHEAGQVDLPRIAELLGRSTEETLAELGEAVFLDPVQNRWETADATLSGPVRSKLAAAREAAANDPRFARNVAALERVQPEDLRPSDITARLGAPWIPAEVVAQFSAEVIGVPTRVLHTAEIAAWSIDLAPFVRQAEATSTWGTERRHAGELLSDALNAVIPQIWDTWRDEHGEHRELNAKATEAAKC